MDGTLIDGRHLICNASFFPESSQIRYEELSSEVKRFWSWKKSKTIEIRDNILLIQPSFHTAITKGAGDGRH